MVDEGLDLWLTPDDAQQELATLRTENRQLKDVVCQMEEEKTNLLEVIDLHTAATRNPAPLESADVEALRCKLEDAQAEALRYRQESTARRLALFDILSADIDKMRKAKAAGAVEALHAAQEFGFALSVPDEVVAASREQGRGLRKGKTGTQTLSALLALQMYAMDVEYEGNFWHWCKHSDHADALDWQCVVTHASDFGASLSDWDRHFPVITDYSETGVQKMNHYICLSPDNSDLRLYYDDDTEGATEKIHIGFVGNLLSSENTGDDAAA